MHTVLVLCVCVNVYMEIFARRKILPISPMHAVGKKFFRKSFHMYVCMIGPTTTSLRIVHTVSEIKKFSEILVTIQA